MENIIKKLFVKSYKHLISLKWMTLHIGKIKLSSPLLLAPMVDVTDIAYRILCRKYGASLAYTEMLNIGAILHENEKTKRMLITSSEDRPLGIQITAPKVDDFKKVIPYIKEYDLVDINCGCPSIRITDNASGSYLLKTPLKIASYIKVLKSSGYSVTAKIRLGYKKNNVLKIAKIIEKAGADAITIHARLSHESYKTPADWLWIKEVKKALKIPVIGNGDVNSGESAKKMLECADAVMIARAAIGNPLIFRNILHYLKTGQELQTTKHERLNSFLEYLQLAEKHKVIELPRIKSLGGYFLSDFPNSSKARASFMQLKTLDEMKKFIKKLI